MQFVQLHQKRLVKALALVHSVANSRSVAAVFDAAVEKIIRVTFQIFADFVQIALHFASAYHFMLHLILALRNNAGIAISMGVAQIKYLVVIASMGEIQIGAVVVTFNVAGIQHSRGAP